ncbi:MAG: two-component sensor histidine kinase [Alphaproteobacteria bacterium]|nr:two-component sensor histidine kinase [Alphaproteobacteria bacterium]MBV9377268.1 two-component sensor histidine kinase [Alphaproteobacteria bacterium]MBV9815815.1 two-component sensor histidine kinase [Alphaproteobacteria bacterium]
MLSSRIDDRGQAVTAQDIDTELAGPEPDEEIELRRDPWIKRVLPRTMFGRSLLIVVMPLILLQAIATWVFYDRHWAAVSWRLSAAVAGDIGLLVEALKLADSPAQTAILLAQAKAQTDLDFTISRAATLPPAAPASGRLVEDQLTQAIQGRLSLPFRLDLLDDGAAAVKVQLADRVLSVDVPRNRLYSSTTYIFVMWMLGSSLVLLAVATVFLRNQVKSLRRLAEAADGFGKGRPLPPFKIEGAVEIRRAAKAFMTMRDRLQRQIRQRTQMLAGVSHDLRTPLTRMKLALELLGNDPAVAELKSDVAEMEHMVHGYLDFARGEGTEASVETDISLLIEDLAADLRREGTPLTVIAPPEYVMPVRPNALRRCLANLIGNARRHGSHVWLTGIVTADGIDILVDDDGPGIPPANRTRVFRPFVRLDSSRNPSTGGVGLGLTIARDVARSHGGDVRLETSPQGGLRARVHLPS